MKKHWKVLGIAALGLAALAVAGQAAGGRDNASPPALTGEGDFADDATMASIDKALGRDAVGAPLTTKQASANEAVRSSAGSAGSSPAAAPPAPNASTAGGVTGAGAAPDTSSLGSVEDRKIVQTASVRLQVKVVRDSFEEVGRIADAAGGFVASSNSALQGNQELASVTIRVPAKSYQQVLTQVRALGAKVDGETSNASDVSEEYSDLSARIRNLEATETQLLQLLGQAKNVSEVLQVQDRINNVRTQIDQAKGRLALLDKLSDLATITVQMRPIVVPVKSDGAGVNLGAEVSRAWDDSLEFLGGIAAGVVSVLVFSWWLVPLAGLTALVWQRYQRGRPAPKAATYD